MARFMDSLLIIGLRTILLYCLILVIFRLMGKREIGELSILDLIVFIMIAEMAVVAIENPEEKLMYTVFPMLILMVIQISLATISLKSQWLRRMLDGKPVIIIANGKIDERAMKRQRYNFDDLIMQLHEEGIYNISEVEFAIIETSGKLSVMKRDRPSDKKRITMPLSLIADGVIQEENLKYLNFTREWLLSQLSERGYHKVENISYCSIENGDLYIDVKD